MFCNWLWMACTDDCSLSILDFSSSIESLTDCTWPDAESTFPLIASFCAASFCCSVSMVFCIRAALSAVCCARVWRVVKRVSSVDCSLCTMSNNCWTWVWRAMISFEAARAGTGAKLTTAASRAAARRRLRIVRAFIIKSPEPLPVISCNCQRNGEKVKP